MRSRLQNNLSYFAALAAVDDQRKRAAVLGVHPPELTDTSAMWTPAAASRAIALEGDGVELGLAPSGRWFVELGEYGSAQGATSAWRQLRSRARGPARQSQPAGRRRRTGHSPCWSVRSRAPIRRRRCAATWSAAVSAAGHSRCRAICGPGWPLSGCGRDSRPDGPQRRCARTPAAQHLCRVSKRSDRAGK